MHQERRPSASARRRSSSFLLESASSSNIPRFPLQQAIECSLLSFSLVANTSDIERFRRQADDSLTSYLLNVLEAFRPQMAAGVAELGIPALDPLYLADVVVDEDQALAHIQVRLDGVAIAGVSAFNIRRLDVFLEMLELMLELTFPSINVTGSYELHGRAAGIVPLSGAGEFWVQALELEASGRATLVTLPDEDNVLQINNLVLDLRVADIELHFENLFGGGAIGSAVNNVASALSTGIFERVKPRLLASLQDALKAKLNDELRHMDISKFIPGGLAHVMGGRGHHRSVTDANEYLDHVLDNAREQIIQGGLDPLPLADGDNFSDGQLFGLATVYRAGDAELSFSEEGTTLEARLGFSDVRTSYKWRKTVMIKLSGHVSARARDISVYVKIKQPSSLGSQPLLEGFIIEQLGRMAVEVTGLGRPVSWVVEKIATLATNMMRRRLAERLTGPVREIIENSLAECATSNAVR